MRSQHQKPEIHMLAHGKRHQTPGHAKTTFDLKNTMSQSNLSFRYISHSNTNITEIGVAH